MKLNFWQWLGVVLLVIATVWWLYDRSMKTPVPPANPPTNVPATSPA